MFVSLHFVAAARIAALGRIELYLQAPDVEAWNVPVVVGARVAARGGVELHFLTRDIGVQGLSLLDGPGIHLSRRFWGDQCKSGKEQRHDQEILAHGMRANGLGLHEILHSGRRSSKTSLEWI